MSGYMEEAGLCLVFYIAEYQLFDVGIRNAEASRSDIAPLTLISRRSHLATRPIERYFLNKEASAVSVTAAHVVRQG